MLIAHLADTHLGIRLYGFDWTYDAILEHFKQAFTRALEEKVDAIILAGDLFDKPRPPNKALKTVIELVSQAVEKGVRVYGVLGEHDLPKVTDIPPQLLVPGLHVFGLSGSQVDCIAVDGREYCIGGVNHLPLKYERGMKAKLVSMINSVVAKMNNKSVLVMHQNIASFEMFEPGLEINEIPEKPLYVAMGHLHRRIIYRRENGQLIVYPGSLDILKRDEISEWKKNGKGFYLVDLSGDEPQVQPVDTEVIPQELVEAYLKELETKVSAVASKLPRDKKSILHVIVLLKTSEKTDVLPIIKRIVSRYSQNISVRVEKKYVEEELGREVRLESVDEVDVIQHILGGQQYRDLAEKIYLLKQALVKEDYQSVEDIVEEIAKHSYWAGRIKPPQITLPTQSTTTPKKTIKPSTTGKRDLLSYLGGG